MPFLFNSMTSPKYEKSLKFHTTSNFHLISCSLIVSVNTRLILVIFPQELLMSYGCFHYAHVLSIDFQHTAQ